MQRCIITCVGLAVVLSLADAQDSRDRKVTDYKSKPLREWLQAVIYHHQSDIGRDAREALMQYVDKSPQALPTLLASLKDKDEAVRLGAAHALGLWQLDHKSEKTVPALSRALKEDASAAVRTEAAYSLTLCAQNDPHVWPVLFRTIREDKNSGVRALTIESLYIGTKSPREAVIPTLLAALKDSDPRVRHEAAWWLWYDDTKVISALVTVLRDDDAYVYQAARDVLGRASFGAIPYLLKALCDADPFVRAGAANALGSICAPDKHVALGRVEVVERALVRLLHVEDPFVRENAIEALRTAFPKSKDLIPDLLEALRAKEEDVRQWAVSVFAQLGSEVKETKEALRWALGDESPRVRFDAARALCEIDPATNGLIEKLTDALKSPDRFVRESAAACLGQCGARAKAAVPALLEASKDADAETRRAAASALEHVDQAAAVKAGAIVTVMVEDVTRYLKDPNVPRRSGPLRFGCEGVEPAAHGRSRIKASFERDVDGFRLGYHLTGTIDLSTATKTEANARDFADVEVRYTDDWLECARLTEKDIPGLIEQLFESKNQAQPSHFSGDEDEGPEFSSAMVKLCSLGDKARPALQKLLVDPRIQKECALILGQVGDESSVAALIALYPPVDHIKKRKLWPMDEADAMRFDSFNWALQALTGQPIGRGRYGDPYNGRRWQEWWALAKKTFKVDASRRKTRWIPTRKDAEFARQVFAAGDPASCR
jgi:HEAT repeat protein